MSSYVTRSISTDVFLTKLSEMNHAVNVWGPILERNYEGADIILKWYESIEKHVAFTMLI